MTYEQNVRAILECCFAQTKDEIIDIACESICELSRWIPCSERLPEKNGNYLVNYESSDGTTTLRYEVVDHYGPDWLHKTRCNKAVAWVPLPEPYEESEVEE